MEVVNEVKAVGVPFALQKAIGLDSIDIRPRGLIVHGSIPLECAQSVLDMLFGIEELSRFAIGDFLNYCEREYRDEWEQLLSERLGKRSGTIENWRYVCRNVDLAIRFEGLSMSTFYKVAGFKSQTLQRSMLRIALAENLGAEDLNPYAAYFKKLAPDEQENWGRTIEIGGMSSAGLYNALLAEKQKMDELAVQPQVAPSPAPSPVVLDDTGDDIEYSGERSDYDWSEEDDYTPRNEIEGELVEQPGALVAMTVALQALYYACDADEYIEKRDTLLSLLTAMDTERAESFGLELE